jgi:hypothetical protein
MRVRDKDKLQQKASFIFQDLEREYQACEMVYIISQLTETMSLVMLQKEMHEEASAI